MEQNDGWTIFSLQPRSFCMMLGKSLSLSEVDCCSLILNCLRNLTSKASCMVNEETIGKGQYHLLISVGAP